MHIGQDGLKEKIRKPRTCELLIQYKELTEWLLLINNSVLEKIQNGIRNYDYEISSHELLIDWVFNENFEPGEQRFPLFGTCQNIDGIHFNESQEILMYYLWGVHVSNKASEVSISLIIFYYEVLQPQIWEFLTKMGNDVKGFLKILVYNAIISHLRIKDTDELLNEILGEVRGLKLMPFEEIPKSLKPKALKTGRAGWKISYKKEEQDRALIKKPG
jgi:hypothetical protein